MCLGRLLGNQRPFIDEYRRCILYIVRRTQLYLDEDLWNALHARARSAGTTISELVREAIRERYLGKLDERKTAMQAAVGLWKEREDIGDSSAYVRNFRRGSRLRRFSSA